MDYGLSLSAFSVDTRYQVVELRESDEGFVPGDLESNHSGFEWETMLEFDDI
jgi:hypothetical protein